MNIRDMNPHLRFAATMRYEQAYNNWPVKVSDCRIFYITDGQAQLHIDGKSYELIPHSLFYCRAGSEYTIRTGNGFSLISLNFDLTQDRWEQARPFSPCTQREKWASLPILYQPVADSSFLNDHLFLSHAEQLYPNLQAIVSEFSGNGFLFRESSSAALKALLTQLHRFRQAQLPPKILLVRDYIRDHYAEPITNQQLADLAGYHEYYLNRIFAEHMGTSLHGFLLQTRLNQASYLILNTDLDLNTISEAVGFRSYPHFSSYFNQTYGYSPAQYRKRLKGSI